MKLLLVEDEKMLSKVITKGLKKHGYAVDNAYDGEEALQFLEINDYDLVILDLNLPKIDGIDVLKDIRKTDNELKVIILSARSDVEDKIIGLDSGANDYLAKPFEFAELEARIRNLLRRAFVQQNVKLSCGEITIDTASKIVKVKDIIVELTKKEYSILEYLMYNKNKVISAEKVIEHVWDSDVDLFSNSFKFHIHSLKKKLSVSEGDVIRNIRGQGYILTDKKVWLYEKNNYFKN